MSVRRRRGERRRGRRRRESERKSLGEEAKTMIKKKTRRAGTKRATREDGKRPRSLIHIHQAYKTPGEAPGRRYLPTSPPSAATYSTDGAARINSASELR